MNDDAQLAVVTATLDQQVADGLLEKVGPDAYRLTDAGRARVQQMIRPRRTWAMTPEPADLPALIDNHGNVWSPATRPGTWVCIGGSRRAWLVAWSDLVYHYGPLTEVIDTGR